MKQKDKYCSFASIRKWDDIVLNTVTIVLPQNQGKVFWCSPLSQLCAAGDCSLVGRFWRLPAAPLPTAKANNNGIRYSLFHSWHFHWSNTGVTNNINIGSASASPFYCACWPTGMDYWHTLTSFIFGHMCFPRYVKLPAVRIVCCCRQI